jgi:hypothetical protein
MILPNNAKAKESQMTHANQTVKTYMALPKLIDPAHILTMADLSLSYALASTLVEWDESRQPVAGLCDHWEFPKQNIIRFTLRKNAKWSTGAKLDAIEVCSSFARAKNKYPDALKSLFDVVKEIRCTDDRTIEFETYVSVSDSNILRKLTEPMYGVVATGKNEELILDKTTGPFYLEKLSEAELFLKKNVEWFNHNKEMPHQIQLKQTPLNANLAQSFGSDNWANMVSINSIQPSSTFDEFKKNGYKIWQRNYDKIFFLSPSKKFISEFGSILLKKISSQIKIDHLLSNLSGYLPSRQFFPRGYVLYDSNYKFKEMAEKIVLKRPLTVLLPNSPSGIAVMEKLSSQLELITGHKPNILVVKTNEIAAAKEKGNFDLLAVNVAVDDPNFEGAMSFFFAGKFPLIPSGDGELNFVEQIKKSSLLKSDLDRATLMRKIMNQAIENGFVAPLFLFSNVFVSKNGVDVSKVPLSKETIPYSAIRFNQK